jgi:putative transposase
VKQKRRVAGLRRQRSLRGIQRDDTLLPRIQALKAEHPCWGDRRLWAYLRFVEQREVNKKCMVRLMREHHLLVRPHLRLKAKRAAGRRRPPPNQAS